MTRGIDRWNVGREVRTVAVCALGLITGLIGGLIIWAIPGGEGFWSGVGIVLTVHLVFTGTQAWLTLLRLERIARQRLLDAIAEHPQEPPEPGAERT